ncbi:MAG: hypothetical protein JO021_01030, partial [Alphaproteobacteria bacterium]|nr:hypothetical protein [Alphaproteobacteria bacterium]
TVESTLHNILVSVAAAALLLALGGCDSAMVAPKTLHGYRGVERSLGMPLRPREGRFGDRFDAQLGAITPLDPDAAVGLLAQAATQLAKLDPDGRWRGITYELSTDNALDPGWLIQTPDVWGRRAADVPAILAGCPGCDRDFELPACRSDADCGTARCGHLRALETGAPAEVHAPRCLGHSDGLLDRIYDLIVGAEHAVDIAMLADLPDIRFRATLRNALTRLARSGRAVTVRLIAGQYPSSEADTDEFLEQVMRDARRVEGNRLAVYVGATRSCWGDADCESYSWNHAKIIAVDGRVALFGGHNMWSRDYLMAAPVHDLSMLLHGSAATATHRFLDTLWTATCARQGHSRSNAYRFDRPLRDDGCLAHLAVPPPAPGGGHVPVMPARERVPVMTVARLASGITPEFADHGDIAEELVLNAARRTIRVSQQDLGFSLLHVADPLWPEAILRAFADLMVKRHGDVYVVLSQPGATSLAGTDYSTGVDLDQVADKLRAVVQRRGGLSEDEAGALMCRQFHLAPLRFGPDDRWPGGVAIANHAKLWVVDDRAFHIGSKNLYPVDLQEFGAIVEDRAATTQLLADYWEPLWQHARVAAISGSDAPHCRFEKP